MVTHTINPLTIGNAFVSQCTVACISTAFSWGKLQELQEQQQQQYRANSYKCDIEYIATKATSAVKNLC